MGMHVDARTHVPTHTASYNAQSEMQARVIACTYVGMTCRSLALHRSHHRTYSTCTVAWPLEAGGKTSTDLIRLVSSHK